MNDFDIDVANVANSLQELVEKNLVDTETLKNKGLNSERCYTYLYLSIDRITPSELSKFNGTNKSSTYNTYNKLTNKFVKKLLTHAKRKISIPPKVAFPTIQDYHEFLYWRAKNREDFITVSQAMAMSGFSKDKIIRSIKSSEREELRAIIDYGKYKIPRISFDIYMKKIMREYKKQKEEIDKEKNKIDKEKEKIDKKEEEIDKEKEKIDKKKEEIDKKEEEIDKEKEKIDKKKEEIDRKISTLENSIKKHD